MTERAYGPYRVELSNTDKVLFPDAGFTKGDLIDYYERIADTLLPHVRDRPLTLQRFPDGLGSEGFYQKQTPDYFPDWIERVEVEKIEAGGTQQQVVCNNTATLVYLANQACITPHVWLSRRDRLREPDRLVFDLDPPGDDFTPVRDAARRLRDLLRDLHLTPHLMLTGSRGAHVVVPLERGADFDTVRAFARRAAELLAARHPEQLTTEVRKQKRGARLFLDVARNAYAQTAVAPYSLRATSKASLATPLDWSELEASELTSSRYTPKNILRRLAQKPDPWAGIDRRAAGLEAAREELARIDGDR